MYRPVKGTGDTVPVPQLLFTRLTAGGGAQEEARFRVALYVLSRGEVPARQVAKDLGLTRQATEAALCFWEGAGLLEQDAPAAEAPVEGTPTARKRMTTREAVRAGQADKTLGALLGEVQRLYGTVVSETDVNCFATLYVQDGFAPDLILMAVLHGLDHGARSARYVEKILMGWRQQGIDNCEAADKHLKLLSEREKREGELARHMGLEGDPFTLAEKRKIAQWHEEYGYGMEMVEAARLAAGDRRNDVKYLAGILKKWQAKGYATPRDVQQGDESRNLRVTRGTKAATGDRLADIVDYVPMKRRKTE